MKISEKQVSAISPIVVWMGNSGYVTTSEKPESYPTIYLPIFSIEMARLTR